MENKELLWMLYEEEGYTSEYNSERNLPTTVKQFFNPIPKIINTDIALTLSGLRISTGNENWEAIKEQIENDNNWKYKQLRLVLFLLMEGNCYVEVSKNDALPGGIQHTLYTEDQVVKVLRDKSERIIYFEVQGISPNGKKAKKILSIEEFRYEEDDGEPIVVPNTWDFVPVVDIFGRIGKEKFQGRSRIAGILDKLDAINEYEWDLREIFRLHANPFVIVEAESIEQEEETDENQTDRTSLERKYLRTLNVPEGTAKYLEMQGNIAQLMKEERIELKGEIKEDYPELKLAEIMSGGAASGYAIELKLTDLLSVVDLYRKRLSEGLRDLWNMTGTMLGYSWNATVEFGPIIPQNISERIDQIANAHNGGFLSRKTAVELCPLSRKDEWERIQLEDDELTGAVRELQGENV